MTAELTIHLLDTRSLWPGDDISKSASQLSHNLTSAARKEVESCGDVEEARALLGRRLLETAYAGKQLEREEELAGGWGVGKNGLGYARSSRAVDAENARECDRGLRCRGGDGQAVKSTRPCRPVRHTAHASGLAVVITASPTPSFASTPVNPTRARTSPALETVGNARAPDFAIAIRKIPTLASLDEIERFDFAAYVHANFSDLLTDEEVFDIVYTIGDGSCVKLLDARMLSSQDVGRSDRVVDMGQTLTVTLTHGAKQREGGREGREEVVTFESDRVIETKLRRLHTFSVLKEALLKLLDDDSLRIGDVGLHNVRAPEPGTVARCSVLGSWGEMVAGEVEVWVRGLKRENVWLGAQGYEEDYLIGIAVATGNGGMEYGANGLSGQSVKTDVKFMRVGIEEVLELGKQSGT